MLSPYRISSESPEQPRPRGPGAAATVALVLSCIGCVELLRGSRFGHELLDFAVMLALFLGVAALSSHPGD
jgi:hypothetical protein